LLFPKSFKLGTNLFVRHRKDGGSQERSILCAGFANG
jgi:hypothetical protein